AGHGRAGADVDAGALHAADRAGRRLRGARRARGGPPLPEVGGHRLIQVHLAARPDVVLDLTDLRARIPLPVGPRVRLPRPGVLAFAEEAAQGAVAGVHAGAALPDDRRHAVEVRVDRALVRGLRVEVDREVDGPARGLADGLRLAVGRLRVLGAEAV